MELLGIAAWMLMQMTKTASPGCLLHCPWLGMCGLCGLRTGLCVPPTQTTALTASCRSRNSTLLHYVTLCSAAVAVNGLVDWKSICTEKVYFARHASGSMECSSSVFNLTHLRLTLYGRSRNSLMRIRMHTYAYANIMCTV